MRRFASVVLVASAVGLLWTAGAAQAATINVTTTSDTPTGTKCTLREAIDSANLDAAHPVGNHCITGSGADTVDFTYANVQTPQTITLASALPPITSDLTIQGPGAGVLDIHRSDAGATPAFRIFNVTSGTVSISGLKVSNGQTTGTGASGMGGGINVVSPAALTLDNVTVDGNNASDSGGGVANTGPLTITNSSITNNHDTVSTAGVANALGGGVYSTGTLSIDRSTVTGNTAIANTAAQVNAGGGGIFADTSAAPTIDRTTIAGNSATATTSGNPSIAAASGGGLAAGAVFTLQRSTVSGNSASASGGTLLDQAQGGGVEAPAGNAAIDRATIAGNTVTASGANSALGGGLDFGGAAATVASSTISGNTSVDIANANGGAYKNTIVSNPLGGGVSCAGATSTGYNIDSGTTCGFTQPTDHQSTNPLLDPAGLSNNGGPTKTIALQTSSPAVDDGLSSAGEITDQRELLRPRDFATIANAAGGNGTDIGAFELQELTPPDTSIASGPDEGAVIATRTPSFGFSATEPGSTFECDIDGGGFSACANPFTTPSLADGQHTLSVRATDPVHVTDPMPATRTFTVDTTGPMVTITSGPAAGSVSNKNVQTLGFSSDDPGATFECAVDGGAFGSCSSSSTDAIGPLADGPHTFSVRGTDPLGNVGVAATRAFTVDTQAPNTDITKEPKNDTASTHARFKFTSNEQGVTFQCSVGHGPFTPCKSPDVLKHLKPGVHRFRVEAIDAAGNTDASPARDRWHVEG